MSAKSKTSNKPANKSASGTDEVVERGEAMTGAEVLVSCLEREGVEVMFAYPGGASMPIHQALTKSEKIRTIFTKT
jgi:acetolactate synthase-1/2/3 large subunit